MTRTFLTLCSLSFLALTLSACGTTGLGELATHLNERGCATSGSAHASAGLTGASLAGDIEWDCKGTPPQTAKPQPTAAPSTPPI